MEAVKGLLLLILFVLVIGAGAFVLRRYIPFAQLQQKREGLAQVVPNVTGRFSQAKETAGRVQEAGRVLGIKTEQPTLPHLPFQLDEKLKLLMNREYIASVSAEATGPASFERVRYEYCQQVVKDYEKRY
jgi:hypothetical protein